MVSQYKFNFANAKAMEQTVAQTLEEIRGKLSEDLHTLVQLNPRSNVLLSEMREAYHLINTATIIWFGEWSDLGY